MIETEKESGVFRSSSETWTGTEDEKAGWLWRYKIWNLKSEIEGATKSRATSAVSEAFSAPCPNSQLPASNSQKRSDSPHRPAAFRRASLYSPGRCRELSDPRVRAAGRGSFQPPPCLARIVKERPNRPVILPLRPRGAQAQKMQNHLIVPFAADSPIPSGRG